MKLHRPFVTAHGRTDTAENLAARLEFGGEVGWGEAAPAKGITNEGRSEAAAALQAWSKDPEALSAALTSSEGFAGGHAAPAARCAAVVAWLDAQGQREGVPLRRILNLPEGEIDSSVTLSLGNVPDVLEEATRRAAEGWRTFKVKLGGPQDEAVLKALRDAFPDTGLRVDANEAWSFDTALSRLALLERLGVELVEQPLPRAHIDESAELARRFDIPIFLDEPLLDAASALDLVQRDAADGGNIKLAKCGGPFEARRILKVLRDHGWQVMMGCMVESSLGIAAAAAFAGGLDYADFDGNALVADDPFTGWDAPAGRIRTPDRPGVGVTLRKGTRLDALQA